MSETPEQTAAAVAVVTIAARERIGGAIVERRCEWCGEHVDEWHPVIHAGDVPFEHDCANQRDAETRAIVEGEILRMLTGKLDEIERDEDASPAMLGGGAFASGSMSVLAEMIEAVKAGAHRVVFSDGVEAARAAGGEHGAE